MTFREKLACKYDRLASEFLGIIDSNCLESPEYLMQLQDCRFLSREKQLEMKENLPLVLEQRTPAECDVLSAYVELNDQEIVSCLADITNDILAVLPEGIEYYAVPAGHYHISVVMLQDLRPVDMANTTLLQHRLSNQGVEEIAEILQKKLLALQCSPYCLSLYGIRIASDGAIIAVFTDDGRTFELRRELESSVQSHVRPEYRKYKKTLIHTTLARILDQVDLQTLLALFEKQRQYFCIPDGRMKQIVSEICLGRETRWMHSEVRVLKRLPLQK